MATFSDTGRKNDTTASSDWLMEKSYLENQNMFLKNQLEENKRLHDTLLRTIEMGIHNGGDDSGSDLAETNRHLSSAIEKMERNCKELEEKVESGKKYKKMVKNSSRLQCVHCGKAFAPTVFLSHLNECLTTLGSPGSQVGQSLTGNGYPSLNGIALGSPIHQANSSIQYGLGQSTTQLDQFTLSPPTSKLDLTKTRPTNQFQITIIQTMVKETSDSKPYTEYLIQVMDSGQKTLVTRKYKEFCDLHQCLTLSFPTLKLPESTFAMLEMFSSPSDSPTSKKPIVIEERRKVIQQYLRDLASIDIVKNSEVFKKFLELSTENGSNHYITPFPSKNEIESPTMANRSQRERDGTPSNRSPKIPLRNENSIMEENQPQSQTRIDKSLLSMSPHSFMKQWKPESRPYNHYVNFASTEDQYEQQDEIQPECSYDFSAGQNKKVPDSLHNRHTGSMSVPRNNQFVKEPQSAQIRGHSNTATSHSVSKSMAFDSFTPQNNMSTSNSGTFKLLPTYPVTDNLPESFSLNGSQMQMSIQSYKNFDTLKNNSMSRSFLSPQK